MKKLILIGLLIITTNVFADAGNAFRFHVDIHFGNQILTGYIYHYSYSDIKEGEKLIDYIRRTALKNKVTLYEEIKSIKLNKELDFAIKRSGIKINLSEVSDIRQNKKTLRNVHGKLILVNQILYDSIQNSSPKLEVYENHDFFEGTTFIWFTWNLQVDLSKEKEDFQKKMNQYAGNFEKHNDQLNQYIDKKIKELAKNKVLLIRAYSPI